MTLWIMKGSYLACFSTVLQCIEKESASYRLSAGSKRSNSTLRSWLSWLSLQGQNTENETKTDIVEDHSKLQITQLLL